MAAVLLLVAGAIAAAGSECSLPSWPCYAADGAVPVVFEYSGSIDGWNGYIREYTDAGKRRLQIANGCFLVVSRGLGEFAPPEFARGDTISYWQSLAAPRGELVLPTGDGPNVGKFNVAFPEPFRTVVDLSRHFDLSRTGVYTVSWGCRGQRGVLCAVEIMFEIVGQGELEE